MTVNTGSGHGNIQLEVASSGTIVDTLDDPLAGPFPITSASDTITTPGQNPVNPLDVVGNNNRVTQADALAIINYLIAHGITLSAPAGPPYYDVNGDHIVSPLDALIVINALNSGSTSSAAGPAELPQTVVAPAVAPDVTATPAVTSDATAAPATSSGDTGLASSLANLLGGLKTSALPALRLDWLASELKNENLNSGAAATIFEALAAADTKVTRSILVEADEVAGELGLDDALLDSILVDLGLE